MAIILVLKRSCVLTLRMPTLTTNNIVNQFSWKYKYFSKINSDRVRLAREKKNQHA